MKITIALVTLFAVAFAAPQRGRGGGGDAFSDFASGRPDGRATGVSIGNSCICTNGVNAPGSCPGTTCTATTQENDYFQQQASCSCDN
ncbi:hypothetical protein BKA61DRAFT_677031 [Leptodontidium sp. MPI-SDFR-AT-0119]|nr:hypothetical protein BKA61DRAFT_677031 [Leptodontidium sp. MPI-SDFR-AT-0119]